MNAAPWRLEVTRSAQRDLRRLDPQIQRRVTDALTALAADPSTSTGLRTLTGRPEARLRVGDWRVLLTLQPERRVVVVLRVLPRGRAYR
ncbi:MAG TPA: type II toxin-antitoxin system RelE/ParE family toxin [Solirubrobacteraceae bacterium]|nr:type II toxin-antitoxin system RelE/ParE family toxin [Solirubrobacteraceae bacterium]